MWEVVSGNSIIILTRWSGGECEFLEEASSYGGSEYIIL